MEESQVLIILLTKNVFTRPWCLVEIKTAIEHNIPIVPIVVARKEFNFEENKRFLDTLSSASLDVRNPGASTALRELGISITALRDLLHANIPNVIAREFDANGTKRQIDASVNDIIDAIMAASLGDHPDALMNKGENQQLIPLADPENPAVMAKQNEVPILHESIVTNHSEPNSDLQ